MGKNVWHVFLWDWRCGNVDISFDHRSTVGRNTRESTDALAAFGLPPHVTWLGTIQHHNPLTIHTHTHPARQTNLFMRQVPWTRLLDQRGDLEVKSQHVSLCLQMLIALHKQEKYEASVWTRAHRERREGHCWQWEPLWRGALTDSQKYLVWKGVMSDQSVQSVPPPGLHD